jgi:hypothetical protein
MRNPILKKVISSSTSDITKLKQEPPLGADFESRTKESGSGLNE